MKCRLCADRSRGTLSEDVDLCGRCARLVAREILGSTHRFVAAATAVPGASGEGEAARDPQAWLDLAVEYAEKGLGADAREAAARAIVAAEGGTQDAIVIGALAAIAHATEGRALEAILRRAQQQAKRPPS